MVYTWFIDTNIIASWIIVESGLLKDLSQKYNYPKEYHELYNAKYKDEVNFINVLLDTNQNIFSKYHEAFVPFLATNELFSAIRDEVISLKLFNKGVPLSRWPIEKNSINFDEEESQMLYQETMKLRDRLFGGNLEIIADYLEVDEMTYWDISASFLFSISSTKTQDVMLLTTAIKNEADFFVTRDERLIRDTKKALNTHYKLKIMLPRTAELKFKEIIKKKMKPSNQDGN